MNNKWTEKENNMNLFNKLINEGSVSVLFFFSICRCSVAPMLHRFLLSFRFLDSN